MDVVNERINPIPAQRGFQAAARVTTVSDSLLEEMTNLFWHVVFRPVGRSMSAPVVAYNATLAYIEGELWGKRGIGVSHWALLLWPR